MNTVQNYDAPASGATIAADEFITQNVDLIGLYPGDLSQLLNERLQTTPVRCSSILDHIALLRSFTPAPFAYHPSHYALLGRGSNIIGFAWLSGYLLEDLTNVPLWTTETRTLAEHIFRLNADAVFLGTTRTDVLRWTKANISDVRLLIKGFDLFGVEVLDYILLYPDANYSYYYETSSDKYLDEKPFVEDDLLYYCVARPPKLLR